MDRTVANGARTLTPQQEEAVRAVVDSGNGVDVIEALAGTGKTHTAGVLRQTYERAGRTVVGVAPTGRAVRELADEAGVGDVRTIHRLLHEIDHGQTPEMNVLLIDEAGMAPTRSTERLLDWAERADVKVVAIGDPGQLPSVQAGGWLRAIGERAGRHELTTVQRQRDAGERRALGRLHDGASSPYVQWADREGRVVVHAEVRGGLDHVVARWAEVTIEHGTAGAVLIARDNDTRQALNDRARRLLRERGALGDDRDYGPVTVAPNDRVICRRNDRLVDVDNGTRGTIRATHADRVVLQTDAGTIRDLPAAYVADHVEPAYALTGHGMQGGTVEWAAVVAEPWDLTRGWSYTALSRARGQTELHVLAAHTDDPDRDDFGPGARPQPPARDEILAQVVARMSLRDDEDLAMDRVETAPDPREFAAERAGGNAIQERGDARNSEPADPDRGRLASLLDERSRLEEQLRSLPMGRVETLESLTTLLDAARARRDDLADRLDALPAPRRRLTGTRDDHAAERTRLTSMMGTAEDRSRELEHTIARHRDEIGADPMLVREEHRALASRHTASRREGNALLDRIATRELEREPTWARDLLGPRPPEPAAAAAWDSAGRAVVRHELKHRPQAEVTGLTQPASGDVSEHAAWRQVHDTVHETRETIERGHEPPDLGPSLSR